MLSSNPRFKFKALELNRKLLENAEHLKKPAVKEPTVPEGFQLQIDKRLQDRQVSKNSEEEEKPQTFKSQPLPKKILEGVVVSLNWYWLTSMSDTGSTFKLAGFLYWQHEAFKVLPINTCSQVDFLLSTGRAREESSASNCSRVSSFCSQEEGSCGSQGRGSKDTIVCLVWKATWTFNGSTGYSPRIFHISSITRTNIEHVCWAWNLSACMCPLYQGFPQTKGGSEKKKSVGW